MDMNFDSYKIDSKFPFLRDKHIVFCLRSLNVLPHHCHFLDSTRLVVAYFAISALDLLDALSKIENERENIIKWIYSLQVIPNYDLDSTVCGFRGSTTCSINKISDVCDKPHLTMTYAALTILLMLGDDLSRIDKQNIILSLKSLQLPNGSFQPMNVECENDMRFVYCACCICYILQDWNGMDIEKTIHYICSSISYDGGIAQGPGLEAHGGSTFCAIASLYLMNKLDEVLTSKQRKDLIRWCLFRQQDGFQGRPNKPTDTCYSFWIGATLKLLKCYHLANREENFKFVLSTQDEITGGIAKWANFWPDILHTYLGISGLSLMNHENIIPVDPALNISQRAFNYLLKLHKKWGFRS